MKRRSHIVLAAWAALAAAFAGQAIAIEAEGVATLDKGIAYARQAARHDARQQLALQRGAIVTSSEQVTSRGDILQSSTVRPAAELGQATTVQEWSSGDNLHVLMQAGDSDPASPASSAAYRKKVLITPFHVNRPDHVMDMDDVTLGVPRNLYERLARTGSLQPRLGRYTLPTERSGATPAQIANAVRALASDNDSQFILTGEVTDAGATTSKGFLTSKTTRNFEIRTALYDGLTGVLVAEHRIAQQGEGEVGIGRHRPFGTASFFSTPFGSVVDSVLGAVASEMLRDLAPLPFTARIVRVENRKVIFDAGTTSAVQPGDKLIAYSKKSEWDVGGALNGPGGIPESPVATVSVLQVQPAFSIGELSEQSAQVRLKAGDYVRFAASNQ